MAKVHHLFYSTDTEKQTLHRRIVPTKQHLEIQQERWNDLFEYLKEDLQEKSGYEVYSWLQGSYKLGTQVRPFSNKGDFDVDLGIYFAWDGASDEGNFSAKGIKDFVQEGLLEYEKDAESVSEVVSPPKKRCARICFKDNFHIDIPVYHLNPEEDARSLATEEDIWEESDPKTFYVWFRNCFTEEENSQIRRLIRYLKIWALLHNEKPLSSICLTVLVAESYDSLTEDERDGDDLAFACIVEKIINRLEADMCVLNPVNSSEDLNRLSEDELASFVGKLHELLKVSENAYSAPSEFESASLWSEAFLHFFPAPVMDTSDPKNRALIPVSFIPDVLVRAQPKNNPQQRTYQGRNRIGPIPKGCIISFELLNKDKLPLGATTSWIVRNEEEEAEHLNDLGHFAGERLGYAEEHSAYKGVHYMDLTVKSSVGEVIGFSRIPVEILGIFAVPRNPKTTRRPRIPIKRR